MKKKVLLTSILTIALCLTLIVGSTYALFTSGNAVNVAVTAGKLEVIASIEQGLKTWSLTETEADARTDGSFNNGGKAEVVNGELIVDRMTPGDTVQFVIKVENKSNVALKYRVKAVSAMNDGATIDLSDALVVTTKVMDGEEATTDKNAKEFTSKWHLVEAPNGVAEAITSIVVTVRFPNGQPEYDNQFKSTEDKVAAAKLTFTVEAVQADGVEGDYGDYLLPPTTP